jgi:hypothetical protein
MSWLGSHVEAEATARLAEPPLMVPVVVVEPDEDAIRLELGMNTVGLIGPATAFGKDSVTTPLLIAQVSVVVQLIGNHFLKVSIGVPAFWNCTVSPCPKHSEALISRNAIRSFLIGVSVDDGVADTGWIRSHRGVHSERERSTGCACGYDWRWQRARHLPINVAVRQAAFYR